MRGPRNQCTRPHELSTLSPKAFVDSSGFTPHVPGMTVDTLIEESLELALRELDEGDCPPRLRGAIRHAVFPAGSRLRPRLVLAVSTACGAENLTLSRHAACAIELLHCASLVHDDLPCFDDAALRRGHPTVHKAFDEPLAVLAGDALIVLAFDELSRAITADCSRGLALFRAVSAGVGARRGIIAGQGWESESSIDIPLYHRAKTGALFEAAFRAGAIAAGATLDPWRGIGERLGEAYQIADDLLDALGSERALGKPVRSDARHGRPTATSSGVARAHARLQELVASVMEAVPACPGRARLLDELQQIASTLLQRIETASHQASHPTSSARERQPSRSAAALSSRRIEPAVAGPP